MTDPQPTSPAYGTAPAGVQPKGLSIASLILGIVGVVLIVTTWPSTIVSIVAVVLGFVARGRQPYAKGFWLTGIILGFVGLVASIAWLVGVLALAAAARAGTLGH